MTKTQAKHHEVHEAYDQLALEYTEVVREEFPVGTMVWWEAHHGKGYIRGRVVEHWSFTSIRPEIMVENVKTRARHQVEARHLLLENPSPKTK
jgi:hypothetical protein